MNTKDRKELSGLILEGVALTVIYGWLCYGVVEIILIIFKKVLAFV